MDETTTCPCCGASVPIPADIADKARHWQKRLDREAENKRLRRQVDPTYCQTKK